MQQQKAIYYAVAVNHPGNKTGILLSSLSVRIPPLRKEEGGGKMEGNESWA